ncbi:BPI fold-containing family B member 1 isoform X2 [Pogona vitticeps]
MQLVLGNCENTPGHIKITLFNNDQPLFKALNDILKVVTNILEKVIPNLLQKQLCPLANGLMQTVLNILQGSISTAANGQSIQLSADSYIISGESMRIDYQGSMQMTGGSSYELPPSSTPLPSVPLGDSSMNIVMSDDLIKTLFLSKMPAQTLTINNEAQVAIFKKSIEAIRGLSLPRGATLEALQISYGAPNVRMTSGKAEMVQEISLTVFGSRPRVANQVFFTIKGKATFAVAFSVSHGKLSFSLSFGSLSELTLENSSVGAFDVWSTYDGISELLSATLIPKANRLLSDGYTLPMVESSETEHFQIATDKDSLVVYTWEEQQVQPQETYVEWVTWEEV